MFFFITILHNYQHFIYFLDFIYLFEGLTVLKNVKHAKKYLYG